MVKFKLGVEDTSFAYHLNLINPDSDEHQEELKSKQIFCREGFKVIFSLLLCF